MQENGLLNKNRQKMKKKIKTWCNNDMTIIRVEIALCIVFGIVEVRIGRFDRALIWLVCFLGWLKCEFSERRIRNISSAAVEIKELYKIAQNRSNVLSDRLDLEESKHFLTLLRMRSYQNDVAFCKREKSCSEYLSYKQDIEEAIVYADEKVRKLSEEYNKKYQTVCL